MMNRLLLRSATLLCVAVGCTNRVQSISVSVLTKACKYSDNTVSPNPIDGVDHYRAIVTAADISPPIQVDFAAGSAPKLDKIPAGSQRVLTLLGYKGSPQPGQAKAFGQSVPFDIDNPPDSTPVNVSVVMRPTGMFSGAGDTATGTTCAELTIPRAGHTATLLQDGRVLFAGGFSVKPAATSLAQQMDESNWIFHPETEVYDPSTGKVTQVSPMTVPNNPSITTQRAFHTASLVPGGQVLVMGGETVDSTGAVTLEEVAGFYDPGSDTWSFPPMGNAARSRHAAVTDSSGRILVLGGFSFDDNNNMQLAQGAYWYDPTSGVLALSDAGSSTPNLQALDFGAATWAGGQWVVTAGGRDLDGGSTSPTVGFFSFIGGTYVQASPGDYAGVTLSPDRYGVATASMGTNADHVLIAGGYTSPNNSNPVSTVDTVYIGPAVGTTRPPAFAEGDALHSPRGALCAAALNDGRALTVGGDTGSGTSKDAELFAVVNFPDAGSSVKLASTTQLLTASRKYHTCTVLQDGSVLVAGGIRQEVGSFQAVGTIEIYTPAPLQ
jgi:hypothetical protein